MKNLCFVCYNFSGFGGVQKVLSVLANRLSDSYNIHVVSLCSSDVKCQYELNPTVKLTFLKSDSSERIRNVMIKSFFSLKKYLNDNSIDIVFMFGHYVPFIMFPVKLFSKSKLVFCDHGALVNQLDDKKATLFRRLASKISDKTVVLTKRTMEDYKKIFNIGNNKIDYIYNWIDDEIFKHTKTYNPDSKKIISVGRFSHEKGYDMLLDVAEKVFEKHPDWEWHIYGDGEQFDKISQEICQKNLQNNVILKGAVNNIYEKYSDYSMYVMTSYREGLPLTLLEAKANALPIVSFNCATGPAEIVEDGKEGYLVDCYDKSGMAIKICELIGDRDLRIEFSNNTLKTINKFDKNQILDKWKNLIDNI